MLVAVVQAAPAACLVRHATGSGERCRCAARRLAEAVDWFRAQRVNWIEVRQPSLVR